MSASQKAAPGGSQPWWTFPIVWMVIGGPAIVVVAGITTAVIAWKHVDPVLDTSAPRAQALQPNEVPALLGRNRAAENAVTPADR
ncbi:MAG TPA: nitrogen fixation protein FixH [Aquabacterium sp.]|uniref:nitrogen fixation protein FixH n=1 Tax=Aquabacterium sp. TaxID=1872578 RepID=UPI002E31B82C|nr:nitrogen fixation protein FixH [Aquabacterium sp.]HEX5372873.1 nitrogen fixation protein FixH [Aquabacterium sp.]